MPPLKECFPAMDEKRRAHVKAEVVLRILDALMPRRGKDGALRFENLVGEAN